ncbi:uncharacterized protein SPAPADRAFT_139977 [Spathaspora passalidarum NRRL Y-27907]|uniref:Uncharacterized protein n=1 Tax=Spathaspora passalidarum (strain NRRL Y-27907 / 11-Y1) TaxID=619300 RepID=G3AQF4_SPAPN|nr:uncharacterized protein SPAPADRAFT_139977 [Spathaspora passalidarum NRRL Y-27907]EGW31501.1 hypothetical protein SPAPADRAFT_139977 [Spathaspora passalidarum NRRL Y-27907]
MIKEPYYTSISSIKPKNANNYSLIAYDLPIIQPTLQNAPRQEVNDVVRQHRHHLHHRKDSIEPYYSKPRRLSGLPPVILNQFMYKDESEDDSCAVISDDEDECIDNHVVNPPKSLLRTVSDNYDSETEEEVNFAKLMQPIGALPKVDKTCSDCEDLSEVNEILLAQVNNPNILINFRERTLSNGLSPPLIHQTLFSNDNYDVVYKSEIRDDYDGNHCEYLI